MEVVLLTTSATGVSSASAAFHIIITNASGSFLHAGFQFSDPVADTDSKATARPFATALLHEVGSFRMVVVAPVFFKDVITI